MLKRRWFIRLFRLGLTLWFIVLLAVSLAGLATLAYNARYAAREGGLIFEGLTIRGEPVGGLTPEDAAERLNARLQEDGFPYVRLHGADQEWVFSTYDLGGEWRVDEAVLRAWQMGRSGIFRRDLVTRLKLLWWGYESVPEFVIEPGQALAPLRTIARQAGHPARRATLRVAGLQAETSGSNVGRELDIALTRRAIEQAVVASSDAEGWGRPSRLARMLYGPPSWQSAVALEPIGVPLAFRQIEPPLTDVEGARGLVAVILSGPVTLGADLPEMNGQGELFTLPRRWELDEAQLSAMLTVRSAQAAEGRALTVDLDRERLRAWLAPIVAEIARPPREGRYTYDAATQTLAVVSPGQIGYALDLDAAVEAVAAVCLSPERTVTLPVLVLSPKVTRADLQALLPLTLVSTGESSFQGSTADRLLNIKVASARFNGVVVPPRSTFSFLYHLGLVTQANGYSNSWVIMGDRTVLGPGGGVCQVSTTCYRAAFWGGYPIVERRPHTYRVSWYEPPLGLDAAVFSPTADMRFQNDTDTPLVIMTEVDEAAAKLYFRFYGRSLGRVVTIEGPESSNPVVAGEPVYDVDTTLAPGQKVQVENAHDGLDVTLTRVIAQPGQETAREEVFSRYEPWPARFRIGPTPTP